MRGFTMVQLLVVVAIIGVLAAVLFPLFAKAKSGGHKSNCLSSLRQLGSGLALYANDQEDRAPTLVIPTFLLGSPQ